MKDLSRQSYTRIKPRAGFVKNIKSIVLFVIAVGVIYIVLNRVSLPTGGNSSVKIQDAPIGLTPVDIGDVGTYSEDGLDLSSQRITLSLVTDRQSGSGSASRTFGAGTYSLNVSARLPDPGANKYGVWLTDGVETRLIDYMSGSGSNWVYNLRDDDNYSDLNEVLVSREITTDDAELEVIILRGSF